MSFTTFIFNVLVNDKLYNLIFLIMMVFNNQMTKFLKMKQSILQASKNWLPHTTGTFPSSQRILLDSKCLK